MHTLTIPPIRYNWKELRSTKRFDISDWNSGVEDIDNFGFEAEGFIISSTWEPLAFSDNKFHSIPNDWEGLDRISGYPNGEEEINEMVSQKADVFAKKIARITQELYMPSIEISLDKGYAPGLLFQVVFWALQGLDILAKEQWWYFLPAGNLPEWTPNVPNYANEYYRYLFEERDGYDIADFRWAGLQLHKWIEDKNMAIYIFNKIRHMLPFFLAISGNSPLHNWRYRGNISERTSTKSSWKMVWIPDTIDASFYSQLQEWLNTTIKSVTPYYYAVRYPRVDIRTIENCSMDMVHDIWVMTTLMDIYYRVTERLKQHYISQEPLPENIFWKDTGCMVETNVIRENFHRAIRKWTKTNFAITWINWEKNFEAYAQNVLDWIDVVPSIFPGAIQKALWIPNNTDPSRYTLSEIGSIGNLWEQSIKNLWLPSKPAWWRYIELPIDVIREYSVALAKHFRAQLNSITV